MILPGLIVVRAMVHAHMSATASKKGHERASSRLTNISSESRSTQAVPKVGQNEATGNLDIEHTVKANTLCIFTCIIMVALCNRADHYIFMLWFVLLLLSFFFPCLISAAADWMSAILPHVVWP